MSRYYNKTKKSYNILKRGDKMSVFLIGMMGVGKSYTAQKLSEITGKECFDTDRIIEQEEKMTVNEIFEKKGEKYFRKCEKELLKNLAGKDIIVATGGGIILDEENRKILKSQKTIYLKDSIENILKRTDIKSRPLIKNNPEKIYDIYEKRKELYEQFYTVEISEYTLYKTAEFISEKHENEIGKEFQKIRIGCGILKNSENSGIIITDRKIKDIFYPGKNENIVTFPCGEEIKDFKYVFKMYDYLIEKNTGRDEFINAAGGGSITDFAGFVASTFKRGIKYNFYPTTLLAMADASVGGKNAVDYKGIKNIIGNFSFPENTYMDLLTLITLDDERIKEGITEIFKISLLHGEFFEFIKENYNGIILKNIKILEKTLENAVKLKLLFVEKDFRDKGIRNILNIGHTAGHVFESVTGYSHGRSVAWGINFETEYLMKNKIINNDIYFKIKDFLYRLYDEKFYDIFPQNEKIKEFIINDKKYSHGKINFPYIKEIGHYDFIKINPYELFFNGR